jgi:chromosome segregation protein
MRIRRIELQGFKSFVDKTVFQLAPGICSIVGPNGSGKSNIIDAIKWTLGEQSASTLRGRAMEDVIFAGAEDRAPANRAEVRLVFDNADGRFGGRYARFDEVEISRRLDRSGRSDYAINKTSARLKDIVDLFLDSGVGARGYSIIEQGRVGFVVNSKSEERRVLIDEVAGINRFKTQRAEAERRMHRTRENLLRVRDLLGEMGRQRTMLQRAARKANRYRELRAAWKASALKALLGQALREAHRLEQGQAGVDEAVSTEATIQARLDQLVVELQEQEVGTEEVRAEHDALNAKKAALDGTLTLRQREHQFRAEEQKGLASRLERIHGDLAEMTSRQRAVEKTSSGARSELTRAREELFRLDAAVADAGQAEAEQRDAARGRRREVDAVKSRALDVRTTAARATTRADVLLQQIERGRPRLEERSRQAVDGAARQVELEARVGSLDAAAEESAAAWTVAKVDAASAERSVSTARDAHRDAATARDDARLKAQEVQARLTSLQELLDGLAGVGDGVRAFLAEHGDSDAALGLVAELLEVPSELEEAVEAALGPLLQGIVVRADAVDELAAWVESQDLERVALVVAAPSGPRTGLAAQVQSSVPGLASVLLDGVEQDGGERFVTPSGRLHDRGILWVGRHAGAGEGVLARRREAAELADRLSMAESALEAAEADVAACAAGVQAADEAHDAARAAVHSAELRSLEGRRDLDEARRASTRAIRAAQEAEAERLELKGRLTQWKVEAESARSEAAALDMEALALEARASDLRDGLTEVERSVVESSTQANSLRIEHASMQQVAAGRLRDLRRLDEEAADLSRRLDRAEADHVAVGARHTQLDADLARLAAQSNTLQGEITAATTDLEAAAARRAEVAAGFDVAQAAVASVRLELDRERAGRMEREVSLAETRAGLQGLADRAAAEFDVQLGPLLDAVASDEAPTVDFRGDGSVTLSEADLDPGSIPQHARDAATHARKLDGIGPVNLGAPAEFEEVDGRFQELQGQKDDLEKALGDLKSAIQRIEKETRERFTEAFHAVAERFAALYPRLVGGGRAELRLTRPEAPLESGVDVVVEPPGKRLQNLTLLSGGEKAMAAIALVFAIFQVKPSPFCLLDEVDAPLDEANSRRFNDTLREMAAETQFVVITHNRTTMEVADVLYGVTMQQPGVSCLVSVKLDALSQDP